MTLYSHWQPLRHGPLRETTQRYRRLAFITRVTQTNSQTTHWRSVNISEGGMFVRAAPTLVVGTVVEIGFCLPISFSEIVTRARVVWTNDANKSEYDSSIPFGMGLEFIDLDQEFQTLIRRYVEACPEMPDPSGGG